MTTRKFLCGMVVLNILLSQMTMWWAFNVINVLNFMKFFNFKSQMYNFKCSQLARMSMNSVIVRVPVRIQV